MTIDLNNRSPEVSRLPDYRQRVTRIYDVLNWASKTPAAILAECWLLWATPDEKYPTCRLVAQTVSGQAGKFRAPCEEPPVLTRVYEEIPQNDEIVVGEADISYDQYGNKTAVLNYLQFSSGTTAYTYVVGSSQAPGVNADCILKTSEATNDGTLIRTKRTFINRGELSDTEQLKFGGKLLLRELTYLNQIPPTPAGFTLVTQSTEFVVGLPVYRYGYASASAAAGGGGVISTETQYNISPDQGATGVTVMTINQITDLSVTSNPITTPSGFQLIRVSYADDAGFRTWTAVYAFGRGVINTLVETKQGGKLVVYSTTTINAVPATPAPTIGGAVTLLSAVVKNGGGDTDGTIVYDYTWAEGNGIVSQTVETKNEGALIIYRTVSLGAVPTPPGSTIGGSVIQTSATSREEDGYTLYDYSWAEGNGSISSEVETRNSGRLVIYSATSLGAPPGTPAATIGGTVVLVDASTRNEDGYVLFSYRWAEGEGVISTQTSGREDFSLVYEVTSLSAAASTPAYPGAGTAYLTSLVNSVESGYFVNRATYIKPPSTQVFRQQRTFKMPGLAYFVGTDLVLQPETERTLLASIDVSYATTQDTSTPFSVTTYSGFIETYVPADTGAAVNGQYGLNGYLAAGITISGSGMYKGVNCTSYSATKFASVPAALPSGSTVIGVVNEPYLTATDGTVIFKRVVTTVAL